MDKISTKGSIIDQIDVQNVVHSGFDRSFHNFLSCKLGKIVPTRVEEVIPGDRIKGSTHIVANFEPLVQPILGSMVLKQETFYVPQSILWKSAHNFFTGKKGFNNPIMSIRYREIVMGVLRDVFADLQFLDMLDYFASRNYSSLVTTQTQWEDFLSWFVHGGGPWDTMKQSFSGFATYNFVVDLCKPLQDHLEGLKVRYDSEDNPIGLGEPDWAILDQKIYLNEWFGKIFDFWFGNSSLMDYMGCAIPNIGKKIVGYFFTMLDSEHTPSDDFPMLFSALPVNWLPFRAAYSIWYWNYRDQLLETEVLDAEEFIDNDDFLRNEVPLLLLLRVRCWFKDTFTTALTNTGMGKVPVPALPSIYMPWTSELHAQIEAYEQNIDFDNQNRKSDEYATKINGAELSSITIGGIQYNIPSNYLIRNVELQDHTEADYGAADYPFISLDLIDRARRYSSWLAKREITGTEYDDVIYTSFMVKLSHVRMRVPELLDASRSTVAMNTIVNNTTIPDGQVAGDKSAVAWAENTSDGVNYFAEEHGYLLSFMTIMPIQTYVGGIDRLYLRQTRFDFAWPEFSQMGFDAVYNAELATPFNSELNDASDYNGITVFGYQGRYYDYKSKLDESHGRLKDDLSFMLFSRDFNLSNDAENQPRLNYIFVHCWPKLDMFVTDDPNVDIVKAVDVAHNYAWERILPVPASVVK